MGNSNKTKKQVPTRLAMTTRKFRTLSPLRQPRRRKMESLSLKTWPLLTRTQSPHPLLVGEGGSISVELSPLQVIRNGPFPILSEDGGAANKNNDGNSSVYTAVSTAMITNSFFKNAAIAASFPQAKYLKLPEVWWSAKNFSFSQSLFAAFCIRSNFVHMGCAFVGTNQEQRLQRGGYTYYKWRQKKGHNGKEFALYAGISFRNRPFYSAGTSSAITFRHVEAAAETFDRKGVKGKRGYNQLCAYLIWSNKEKLSLAHS